MDVSLLCPLCDSETETAFHLFTQCIFAKSYCQMSHLNFSDIPDWNIVDWLLRAIYQIVVQNFQNSIFMVDFKKNPFFVVWFQKNSQFMVWFDRFDLFWSYFACGSGEMAPWNILGAFHQSHW